MPFKMATVFILYNAILTLLSTEGLKHTTSSEVYYELLKRLKKLTLYWAI